MEEQDVDEPHKPYMVRAFLEHRAPTCKAHYIFRSEENCSLV